MVMSDLLDFDEHAKRNRIRKFLARPVWGYSLKSHQVWPLFFVKKIDHSHADLWVCRLEFPSPNLNEWNCVKRKLFILIAYHTWSKSGYAEECETADYSRAQQQCCSTLRILCVCVLKYGVYIFSILHISDDTKVITILRMTPQYFEHAHSNDSNEDDNDTPRNINKIIFFTLFIAVEWTF